MSVASGQVEMISFFFSSFWKPNSWLSCLSFFNFGSLWLRFEPVNYQILIFDLTTLIFFALIIILTLTTLSHKSQRRKHKNFHSVASQTEAFMELDESFCWSSNLVVKSSSSVGVDLNLLFGEFVLTTAIHWINRFLSRLRLQILCIFKRKMFLN